MYCCTIDLKRQMLLLRATFRNIIRKQPIRDECVYGSEVRFSVIDPRAI